MIYGITIQQLVKNVPGDDIEISLEGIDLKERHLTWDQIMGTYILLSSYRTQLVLLLNDGEIIKQDLQNYGTFSFRKSKQIAEICQYIEHFKSKVPGW
jgi:hypothetical protein